MSMNKPTFSYNNYGVKSSKDTYRNIGGVHYSHETSDTSNFEEAMIEAKEKGLKIKMIKGELYVEKK